MVVTWVGGVVVLLQVQVMVDNQSTHTFQDRMGYCYRRNKINRAFMVHRPFRRKKAGI